MLHAQALLIAVVLTEPDLRQTADLAAREIGFHGALLVQSRGQIAVNKAVGTNADQANSETRYWVASISKSFTATLIFKLQEREALKLSDSITRFFPGAPKDKRSITIEQLLTHASGLPNKYAAEGSVDRGEAVERILAQPLVNAPGKQFGVHQRWLFAACRDRGNRRQQTLPPASRRTCLSTGGND
jgi:CubicO group peptidase (beta-lactamase class C family)